MGEFLKFLQKNSDTFFLTQYTRRECFADPLPTAPVAAEEAEGSKAVDTELAVVPASSEEPGPMNDGADQAVAPMEVA